MKNTTVETLRGTAIILVVIGHIIGSDSTGGMKVCDDSIWRYFYYSFQYLRLPLFTVLSGYVYSLHPAKFINIKTFINKKIRRLLLPLIFVGGLYYIIRYFVPGTNFKDPLTEIWKLLFYPYTLYWYLPSLFIIFLVVSILDSFNLIRTFRDWISVMALATVLLFIETTDAIQITTNYFSFKGAMFLFPHFIFGIGLNKFKHLITKFNIKVASFFLILCIIIQQFLWFSKLEIGLNYTTLLSFIIGVTFSLLMLSLTINIKILTYIAKYAYSIYLFHAFGTAGVRIIFNMLNITNALLIFSVSIIVAIGLSIITEIALNKLAITRLLFLGRSYKNN